MKPQFHTKAPARLQRGISLFTVLVLLLLCLTAVLGGFRVANLNEAMLGNSADYSRAQAAAEALIRDAEMDIRGRLPPYTLVQPNLALGWPCRPKPAPDTNETLVGYSGCRNRAAANTPWFPNSEDFDTVSDIVATGSPTWRCLQAICMPINATNLARIEDNLAALTPFGATYGQYTRVGLAAPGVASNPILTSNPARAWYWVEGFRYSKAIPSGPNVAANVVPDEHQSIVYRITAVAQGMKAGTQVVIKTMFVPFPASQNK